MASIPHPSKLVEKWQGVIKRVQKDNGKIERSFGSDRRVFQVSENTEPRLRTFLSQC